MSDITVEDLQQQLLEQQEQFKQLKAQNDELNKDLTKTKEDLEKSREINNKLWTVGVSTPMAESVETESEPESVDDFIDSFVEPAVNRMKKLYGDDKVGYHN